MARLVELKEEKAVETTLPIGKPNGPVKFIRFNGAWLFMLFSKSHNSLFIVDDFLVKKLPNVKKYYLAPYISQKNQLGVFAYTASDCNWHYKALEIIAVGEHQPVIIKTIRDVGYEFTVVEDYTDEQFIVPENWLEQVNTKIEARVIDSLDHPVAKEALKGHGN
ncbi:hypothetical protein [Alishewanella sp. SMS8]|uniref:hypothetical protein n=1 Tax=Alishewanella sp. SMS8 TaxID=2994676 RepID=UPI0027411A51|nr:hypothetical protein [Alishewanella sp. SMS8]MDP5459581.1 hypothetical protein [Alishewanella sp. SMS8]